MKQQILFSILLLFSVTVFSQDTGKDPYAIFGHKSSTKYETRVEELLYIKNSDSTSKIKSMLFDMSKGVALILGANNKIIDTVQIKKEQILRWVSTDPMANKREWLSPYNFVQNNPILRTDPTGALDWVPEVQENKNAAGDVTSAQLVLKAEKGDNAQTLAKFLNTDQNKANQLYATMKNGTVTPTNDIAGIAPINAAIKDYVDNSSNYSSFRFGNLTPTNYNCWESAISISKGQTPDFTNLMSRDDFKKEITSNYTDVADKPSDYKFGQTVIRIAESKWSILHGSYSVTTHGAVYLGTSNDGTQYTWSKNGQYNVPGVFTIKQLTNKYGKVEGYRVEAGGGYYNRK